jgi:hypothetical protein
MPKKNFRQSADDPFGDDSSGESGDSWVQTSSQIFGDLANVDAQVERIQKIDIFHILPDPTQPRRVAPSLVRQAWDGTPASVAEMFRVWWGAVQEERGTEFNLSDYLESSETDRSTDSTPSFLPGSLEEAFMTIINLAASIHRDGLTNPITVAPTSGHYRLETGERRWLAYHLLTWYEDHREGGNPELWQKIPARQVAEVDVWRQASENNSRADLNAIGKARQWAVLMMDLNGGGNFSPLEAFATDLDYYAQAVNLRPPYGKGEQLLNAMGVNGRSALARYRALLLLPDEIWQGGDDLNLPEETLYGLAQIAKTDPAQALEQYHQIVPGRNIAPPPQPTPLPKPVFFPAGTKRHFSKLARVVKKTGRGKHKSNAEALKTVRELRDWLDEQEARIMDFLD